MTNKEILKADLLDILFEHRNKLYGAYALRRSYNQRLGTALGLSLSVVLFFILMSFIGKNDTASGRPDNDDKIVQLTQIDLPEQPKEPEPPPREEPRPVEAEVDYNNIIVVPNEEVTEPLPETNDMVDANIGNENREGTLPDGLVKPVNENNSNGQNDTPVKITEDDFKPDEVPASFPGGTAAWLGFLQRYLQTPGDLEAGQRVEVKVRFWIDTDGSLSRFEIVQSGGASFDKEVLRVMRKMPKWEPARQNKHYVAVAFTQPVTFVGVEE
jgi:protein TonB